MKLWEMRRFALTAWAFTLPVAVQAQAEAISIECTGVNESSLGNCVPGDSGQAQCWSTPTSSGATVFVLINEESGRVRIPSTLFSLKGDGWVDIQNLEVGEQLITGRLTFSSFTKPRLKIDRFAGTIDIRSSSQLGSSFTYSGTCAKADLDRKRF